MKRLLLFVVVLLLVAGVVVATLPARLAFKVVPEDALPVQLEGMAGTIWNGRVEHVMRNGTDLGQGAWHLRPQALLSGRLDADLLLNGQELNGAARVAADRSGRIRVDGARASFPAARLQRMLDIPDLVPSGTVEVTFDALELQGRVPLALQGKGQWRDAGVSGAEQAVFGTIGFEFGQLPGGGFGGRVHDEGDGPLALNGEFRTTITGYEGRATLNARDGNPQVQRALQRIGQMQDDGSVVYEVKGGLVRKEP